MAITSNNTRIYTNNRQMYIFLYNTFNTLSSIIGLALGVVH